MTSNQRKNSGILHFTIWSLNVNFNHFRNILLNKTNQIKLGGFGNAMSVKKFVTPSSRWFTPAYAAPERHRGHGGSFESDVW